MAGEDGPIGFDGCPKPLGERVAACGSAAADSPPLRFVHATGLLVGYGTILKIVPATASPFGDGIPPKSVVP